MEAHCRGRRDLTLLPPSSSSPLVFLLPPRNFISTPPSSLRRALKVIPTHIYPDENTSAHMLLSAISLSLMSRVSYQQSRNKHPVSTWVMDPALFSLRYYSYQQGGNGALFLLCSQADLWTLFALLSHECLVDTLQAVGIVTSTEMGLFWSGSITFFPSSFHWQSSQLR